MIRRPPRSPLFPSTPLSRSERAVIPARGDAAVNLARLEDKAPAFAERDDHVQIHRLASPPAPARTATLIDSPSGVSSGGGLEPSHFAQELGRARRLADEARDLVFQQGAHLALAPADPRDERLLPARRAQPLEPPERRGRSGNRPRVLARARLADDAARAERRPGERVSPAAHRTRVQSWPVPKRLERAHAEADGDARRRDRPLEGTQAPGQPRAERPGPG